MRTRETPPYLPPEGIALVGRTHAHGELAAFGEIKPGLQGLGVGEELHCLSVAAAPSEGLEIGGESAGAGRGGAVTALFPRAWLAPSRRARSREARWVVA